VLYLHRSERADYLADALGDVLCQPLADPMAREVVAVPTRGVERWLSQRLAKRLGAGAGGADGVCANMDWPFPGTLVAAATASVCGPPPGGEPGLASRAAMSREGDPWSPERSVWALVQLIDEHLDEDFLAPLAGHLRASSPCGPRGGPRRFGAARHLADLFDRYAVHRPEMLLAWKDGDLGELAGKASRGRDVAWQAELWRRLRQRLGVPSPAERSDAAPARIEEHPELLALPERMSCFGLTRLPGSYSRVLRAISAHRDVHLFLLYPSEALWAKVAEQPRPAGRLSRREDVTAELAANPLLRSWGRDAREMQLVLEAEGALDQGTDGRRALRGEHRPVLGEPATLLGLVQADVRADRQPPGPPGPGGRPDVRPLLADDDHSLRVHSCHGRARQVEVAREAVLHLLRADPTLEPRDVIVMCPDIEAYAPLVSATFGAASLAGAPELRARLADRSLRQTNPLLAVAAHLLEIAGGRARATQILDFASREPVRRRFGFDEEDLSLIEGWLVGTGVRWGLDSAHRAGWKLGGLGEATWRAGLDRLLLGVAMADDGQLFGGTLPFGDMSSREIELAGRLAELVERLGQAFGQLAGPRSAEGWATALAEVTERLACPAPGETWQVEQVRRTLAEVAGEPVAVGAPVLVDLAEARALLEDRLRGRPTRANFRTGDMTICTLVPMRSVPHRVVCLLGLDDGVFPRAGDSDGDDLLLADPLVGDRDVPSEDRQLLLDALLAATQHLVITYEGRDQHLNQRRPPAVPVAELLDVIDRTVRTSDPERPARDRVLVHHPLQSFDSRNFVPGGLGIPEPWRFDEPQLDGARALAGPRRSRRPFLVGRLPPLDGPTVQLRSLVRFLEHPVKAFLRERLGLYAGDAPDQLCDCLPLELGPLDRWALGDRLLTARLAGADLEGAVAAEIGRGLLPPGPLGQAALAEVTAIVGALVAGVDDLPCAKARSVPVEVNVVLPDGRSVVGTVPGVRDGTIVRCTYSKLAPKHRARAWAQFLALSAAHPRLVPGAVTIGQAEGSTAARPRLRVQTFVPLAETGEALRSCALELLSVLVDLFDRGMREPLPLYCATSAAWAQATRPGENPADRARPEWTSKFDDRQGEAAEPEHVAVLGAVVDFEHLLDCPPGEDESGTGWAMGEKSRFGRMAMRMWGPLLGHEHLRER
jgi:exodeoxyribonuclease V gamma subunit